MSPAARRIALRTALYGTVLLWLGGDFLFRGPISTKLGCRRAENPIAAIVGDVPLTESQLQRAIAARLWAAGKSAAELTPAERALAREAALDELIDDELLNRKSAGTRIAPAETDSRLRMLASRFENRAAMEQAMIADGIPDEDSLRRRIEAEIRRETWLRNALPTVSDTEIRTWYDEHRKSLAVPSRVRLRHVFQPTLDQPSETARRKLETALADLTSGKKEFATIARESSADPATSGIGGELGWISRDRLIPDFTVAAFDLKTGKPTLVQSKLGWHILEATARQPASLRSFEEARAEIHAALQALKHRDALRQLRLRLREEFRAETRRVPNR